MLCSQIDSFTATPAALLGAYPSLPLLGGVRQALLASLAAAVKVCGLRCLPCMCGHACLVCRQETGCIALVPGSCLVL